MLSVEQEPIRLPRILTEIESAEGRRIRFEDGRSIGVPRRFLFLWDQVKIGASIYDLSLRIRARGENSRLFLEVASFLCFLVDHDLIDDIRVVRLADSIRGEYEWPQDLVSEVSWSTELGAWGRRMREQIPVYSRSFDLMTMLLVFLSIPFAVSLASLLFQASEVASLSFGLFFLGGLFLGGTLGRSTAAGLRALAASLAGDAGELGVRVDILGPHLTFAPRTVTGGFRRFMDFFNCFGALAIPLLVVLFARFAFPQVSNSAWSILLFGSLFQVAFDTHPSTRSSLTTSLRIWNRTPMAWREADELQEVETFHRIGGFISIFVAAVFFGGILAAVFRLRPDATFFRSHIGDTVLFALLVALAAFVYIEPFFRVDLPGDSQKNKRRRLWATRAKVLTIAAEDRETWSELPVLRQLTAPLRRQLIGSARVVEFGSGQAICRQGDRDRSLYIVLEGKLAVAKSYEGRRRKVVAILSAGAVFGETAFFFGNERTADVVPMEKSRLIEIPYLPMMRNLDISSSEEFQFRVWLLQALSGNPMLKDLPSEAMDTLIFAGARKNFRAGEVIFTEGAPATTCYFIAQGRASAVQQGRKIREMGAGDAFGEIALLNPNGHRTASVVADSDLLCMELNVENFWALLAARLPLGAEIERLALRRLRDDQARREPNS